MSLRRALIALILSMPLPSASAGLLHLSTLGAPFSDDGIAVSYNQWLASSIVAASDATPMTLKELSVRIATIVPNNHLFVGITGSLAGRPDLSNTLIETNVAPINASDSTPSTLSLQPTAATKDVILQPDATYWLVIGATQPDPDQAPHDAGLYRWSYTTANGPFSEAQGWTVGAFTANGNTAGQTWSPVMETPYSFSASLSAVPEPQAAVLMMLVMASTLLNRRRSRRLHS